MSSNLKPVHVEGLSWRPTTDPLAKFGQPDLEVTQTELDELCAEGAGVCMHCGDITPPVDDAAQEDWCSYCKKSAVFSVKQLVKLKAVIITKYGLEG